MKTTKPVMAISGWVVFAIAFTVYLITAERTGSLWDCGEFIAGAYKLQVVHPPGAPLFLIIARLFTWVADLISDNPDHIAFSVNILSGLCTAFAAFFVCQITIILGKRLLLAETKQLDKGHLFALSAAGLIAGFSTAFSTSIWFSAVEGEVYAMSTFFTTLTLWAAIKWYDLPDEPKHDRWFIFAIYAAGLSIGVHLLSILTFPALAIFYYLKKYPQRNWKGLLAASTLGVLAIGIVQKGIITGIPSIWGKMELLMVNQLGFPIHSGLIPLCLLIGLFLVFGLRYAHRAGRPLVQNLMVSFFLLIVSFSTIGVVLIRANAATPINMNNPSDAMRLSYYLNREQYGERPLMKGPQFNDEFIDTETEPRYGRVKDRYEITDEKVTRIYRDKDRVLFPRMSDITPNRRDLYKAWMNIPASEAIPADRPNWLDNIRFFLQYQIGWMYWRYFMWNFSGRQNNSQGMLASDKSSGHWITGIHAVDTLRLGNQYQLPETIRKDKSRNTYFMLPFLFGLLGLYFYCKKQPAEGFALLSLFLMTGIGIIIYSNQPPGEPRERDYVLVGSFLTFATWIGFAAIALSQMLRRWFPGGLRWTPIIGGLLIFSAPLLMGFENFDDHNRRLHRGARDYAVNFLHSCQPNAIIFTFGDNDTYPLWYAQEVEGVRKDVRVINSGLLAVDWYIDLQRRQVNDSLPVKMTLPKEALRGKKRNHILFGNEDKELAVDARRWLQFIAEDHPVDLSPKHRMESFAPTWNTYIPVEWEKALATGMVKPEDQAQFSKIIPFSFGNRNNLMKGEIAMIDIIASNIRERPIYFSTASRLSGIFGLEEYLRLEGLALRLVPLHTPVGEDVVSILDTGYVDVDLIYDNVMHKFAWSNFDKYDLHVYAGYNAMVAQHMQLLQRTARTLLRNGDPQRAVDLTDKYFEAFPHRNFPYTAQTFYMMEIYLRAGLYEKAKPHLQILARETEDHLQFYESLAPNIRDSSYRREHRLAQYSAGLVKMAVEQMGDEAFLEEVEERFASFELGE